MEETKAAAKSDTAAFVIDCNLARGASGIDILQTIRRGDTQAPANAIVIMTSGDHRLEEQTYTNGANQFLLKPYSPDVLSTNLQNFLAGGEKHGK